MNFTELNLDASLLEGVNDAGYVTCTEVQEKVYNAAKDGADLYVQSQTGTGKTAAYLVSVIQQLISKPENAEKKVLVLVPTRELAVQVEQEAKTLLSHTQKKVFSFYGGVGYERQIGAVKKGVDVIVGTPGRIIDLCEGNNLSLKACNFTVIDEADRMFDMGFYPDLRKILKQLPEAEERQTMLFSATLNSYVKNLAWEYTRDPVEIEIEPENVTVTEIEQQLFHVSSDEKTKLLVGILKNENPKNVMIFCNTKRSCEVIAKRLQMNDLKSDFIIGDLPQAKRLKVLNSFKAGEISILVATDVAARGIDVEALEMVINYDLPNEAENYVHRIGRTARNGKSGKAYTFCSEQDVYNLPAIERYIEMSIPAEVAYPEMMAEDKSEGIYIKTGNYYEEDDRKDRRDRNGRGRDNRQDKRNQGDHRKDSRGPRRDGDRKPYNKDKPYNKYGKKYNKLSDKDMGDMQNMSFEDRMKVYKDRYGNGASKGNSQAKSYNKDGRKPYNKNGKNNNYRNNNKNYKGSQKNYSKESQKPVEKKGFLAKLKSLFGKK